DIKIKDSLKRSWQCSTIQVDFNLPERYDLVYVKEGGTKERPIMVHRALMGSLERFFGILIEHYAGAFPVWLAPVQALIATVTTDQNDVAWTMEKELRAEGFRVEVDDRHEKLGLKIREAQMAKIPYTLVLGKREAESGSVAVRSRIQGDLGVQPFAAFKERLATEVRTQQGQEV
ncbi:MAG: threonine--tRNA ligase, partial [Deltaproteobacteria bacterium]|nr:threonine--tRNA ligase [Deltaproteobacteria bacterium]